MRKIMCVAVACVSCVCLGAGCGGGSGKEPKIVSATGIVTYNGAPLAGAQVTFMPDDGPLATGVTDLKGEFKLKSGTLPGCTLGRSRVSVRAMTTVDNSSTAPDFTPGAANTPADFEAQSKKMAQMTQAYQARAAETRPISLIPERYKDPKSSGLQFTVDADGANNIFKLELKD